MFGLEMEFVAAAMRAEREREIEAAIRHRQLVRPQDGPTESVPPPIGTVTEARTLAVRVRPSGG